MSDILKEKTRLDSPSPDGSFHDSQEHAIGGEKPKGNKFKEEDENPLNDPTPDESSNGEAAREGSQTEESPEKTGPPLTKWQKTKKHFRKFWWWYAIAGVVLLAILLPLLFCVILPAIVQDVVNSQNIPIYGGALRALSPDTIGISLETSLDTPLPATIDEQTLGFYLTPDADVWPDPFNNFILPKVHVNGKTNVTVMNQTVDILDNIQLTKWFDGYFMQKTQDLTIRSKPHVHLSSLSYHTHLKKTITIPTLNYLKGFSVLDISFNLNEDNGGKNMAGHLNLPNAGVLILDFGNLTLDVSSGGVNLGYVEVPNVVMNPGDNKFAFTGVFDFTALVPNLASILDSQMDALSSGEVEFNTTGRTVLVNGEHILYLEQILAAKVLTFRLPVITLLGDVLNGLIDSTTSESLLDIVTDVFGNTTLLEGALDHWDEYPNASNATSTKVKKAKKRSTTKSSFMWKMLTMATRAKRRVLE